MPDTTVDNALSDASRRQTSAGTAAEQTPPPAVADSSAQRRVRRNDLVYAFLLCIVTFALWIPRLGGPIDLRTDAAVYYVTGVAIAEGHGYSLTSEPGGIAAVQYPPLLPAFVAVHRLIAGTSDPQVLGAALRKSYLLISLTYALAVYLVARQFLAPTAGFLAGLITSLFLQTYFLSNSLFAEIPFALVTMLFILCSRRTQRPGWFACSALLAVMAYLVRTAGIALLAAWVGEALVRRKWRQVAARALVAVVPVIGWQAYVTSVTSSEQYGQPVYEYQRAPYLYHNVPYGENVALIDPFQPENGRITMGDLLQRLATNLLRMPLSIGHSISTVPGYFEWTLRDAHNWLGLPQLPVGVAAIPPTLLGLLVIAGLILLAWRGEWLIVLFVAATVCMVALTPWPVQFTRYLTPLTPLLAICLVLFLCTLRNWLAATHKTPRPAAETTQAKAASSGTAVFVAVAAFIVGMQIYSLTRAYRSGWTLVPRDLTRVGGARLYFFDEKWMSYAEAVDWLSDRVEPGDIVTTSAPQWTYLAGGFMAVMPAMEIDRSEAQRLLDTVPVRYAIIDRADPGGVVARYLEPTIVANPEKWRLVFSSPDNRARIYERVR